MIGALVLSKGARVLLLAEPELTRATAARGSGVDVDVEVVGGGASGQSWVIDEQEGRERQHTRQASEQPSEQCSRLVIASKLGGS